MSNPIDQQQLRPPAPGSGLLGVVRTVELGASGDPITGDLVARWQGGVAWTPEGGQVSGVAGYGLCSSVDRDEDLVYLAGQSFVPFDVWAEDRCSTIDRTRDFRGRADRALAGDLSYQVAAELERGAISQADTLGNPYLEDGGATELVLASTAFASVFPMLDGALTRALRNRQGMIHCAPEHLAAMAELDLVRWAASVPITPNGHVIAADAGYRCQADPDGGSTIYGTDLMAVLLGPVGHDPERSEQLQDQLGGDFRFDTNDLSVRAYRTVGIQWDRAAHLSVVTDVALALPEFFTGS